MGLMGVRPPEVSFWPEPAGPLLVATTGKADTEYQIWVGSFRFIAAVDRAIAGWRDLTHPGSATGGE
jgi:hypothetical protein